MLSVWLVSGYTHVFILLSVVIVTLPHIHAQKRTAGGSVDFRTHFLYCFQCTLITFMAFIPLLFMPLF